MYTIKTRLLVNIVAFGTLDRSKKNSKGRHWWLFQVFRLDFSVSLLNSKLRRISEKKKELEVKMPISLSEYQSTYAGMDMTMRRFDWLRCKGAENSTWLGGFEWEC